MPATYLATCTYLPPSYIPSYIRNGTTIHLPFHGDLPTYLLSPFAPTYLPTLLANRYILTQSSTYLPPYDLRTDQLTGTYSPIQLTTYLPTIYQPTTTVFVDMRLWKTNTRGNVPKISVNHTRYRQIGSKSTNLSPLAWRKEGRKVTLAAVIGGFRSDLLITRKTDGNFGNVPAGVLFSKVAYQRKRW